MTLSAHCRVQHEPLSLDGTWRIYFGKKANPMVFHLSGTCVGHRDTPVPTEDTTSLQPSHSRLQVASLREDGRAHTMHLFVFEHIALEVFSVARPNAHLSIWNVPERHAHLSVFRHDDTSSVLKACSLTVPMFGPAPRRTQHHWNRNEVPEEWHNRILMQGDISNACGSINRLQVLEAVRMHISGLPPLCASQCVRDGTIAMQERDGHGKKTQFHDSCAMGVWQRSTLSSASFSLTFWSKI